MSLFTQVDRKVRYGIRSTLERLKHLPSRPALTGEQSRMVSDLHREGVHVTSLDRLFGESQSAAAYFRAAAFIRDPLHRDNATIWRKGISSRDITPAAMLAHLPDVYLAGLDGGLLDLVGGYLGKSVAYHGSVIRHSTTDGVTSGTRVWHQDGEDANVFRMVVYLNDVEPGGGPFEYIPRSTGLSYRHFDAAPLTNERVESVIPRNQWRQVYGPAGTVVLCDTARTFHHESIQEKRARSVVMVGYSSRFPRSMELSMAHFPVEQVATAMGAILPADRREFVQGWRKPAVAARELQRREARQSLKPA